MTPRFWAILCTAVAFYIGSAYAVGFVKIYRLTAKIRAIEAQIAAVEAENEGLRRQLEYINSDAYIEAVARSELGLVRPGETAVVLVKPDAPADPVATRRGTQGVAPPTY